jgi:hypothetical protein
MDYTIRASNSSKGKKVKEIWDLSQNGQRELSGRGVRLTTYLHLVPRII